MGKIKTVVMGDLGAEEAAKKNARIKREQKSAAAKAKADKEAIKGESEIKSDIEKSQEILKRLEEEERVPVVAPAGKGKKRAKELVPSPLPLGPKQKHGRNYLQAVSSVDKTRSYPVSEAIPLVKKTSYSQFDGTVEAHFNVSEKGLRGTVQLPHGTGKKVSVAVADDKLIEEVAVGKIRFDVLVASPSMMPKLAKVAKILGPKGLMPNPKTGTISEKPEELVKILSSGRIQWKTEPEFPIVHTVLGKVSFVDNDIEDNFAALAKSIGKDKIKSVFLKATMGPSVRVSL